MSTNKIIIIIIIIITTTIIDSVQFGRLFDAVRFGLSKETSFGTSLVCC